MRLILFALLAVSAYGQAATTLTTSGSPAPVMSGTGTPDLSQACNGAAQNILYIQTDATTGRFWVCNNVSGAFSWYHLVSPIATATTGAITATALILGGCTSTTVPIAGAVVGVNSATASPIGQPTTLSGTAGLVNTTAWVSSANTVTVSVCALASLTTAAVPYRVLLY